MPFLGKIKTIIIGKAYNPSDKGTFHKLALIALLAWIGLGSDALSSSSYGPAEAFLTLGGHAFLAPFVALFTILTIFVIAGSYSQIIEKFPTGGGGYVVASKLLSPTLGMISGCALLIDYVLTIAISVASGADAIFSFLPASWIPFKLAFAIACITVLILLNLRGVKESVLTLVPIFAAFVVTHVAVIAYAVIAHFGEIPAIFTATAGDLRGATVQIGAFGVLLLLLRAYSMGAGTYTGIEAVSNGISSLREPRVKTAKQTMRYMAISLAFMVFGLMLVYLLYGVSAAPGKSLNAVAYERITQGWGTFGTIFVLVTLLSEAGLLFVAAQTGFIDGPRVLANMSLDNWFPTSFSTLSDRLVTARGVIIMGAAALAMLLLTHGSVSFLVVLYSITVFITFTLSQAGMVRYWWGARAAVSNWRRKMAVNGIGTALTAFILISLTATKFHAGGWITLAITTALIILVAMIKRHYDNVANLTKKLDVLVSAAESSTYKCFMNIFNNPKRMKAPSPDEKTAVLLVNGFNGVGIQALNNIFKMFGGVFKNFIFVEVGVVDAGVFKGPEEMGNLRELIKKDADRYVKLMQRRGYYAESITATGTDVVNEAERIAHKIREKFPQAVFFGGQLVFKKDSAFTKVLHNYTVFALEKRLFPQGIPFVIIPIKV